jgi:hypothetical protein
MFATRSTLPALILIGSGIGLLLTGLSPVGTGWPFLLLLPGLTLLGAALTGDRRWSALAIPGAIASATGALLLYQASTGHWGSWAYAWALVGPTATGVGLLLHGRVSGKAPVAALGAWMATAGLALFVCLGLFVESARAGAGGSPAALAGPLLLVVAGAALLLRRTRSSA